MVDKAALRKEARGVRRGIPPEERAARSERIRAHVMELPEMVGARHVGGYVSAGSEVETRTALRELLARGVVVAVPVTLGDRLEYVRLDHPWTLKAGAHGIEEPRQPWTHVDGESLDVVLVPGLRFGRDGSRLGNGGGHFDRYLALHPTPLRVALAFSEQVVDRVPTEEHDQGVDVIVTEQGRVRAGRA